MTWFSRRARPPHPEHTRRVYANDVVVPGAVHPDEVPMPHPDSDQAQALNSLISRGGIGSHAAILRAIRYTTTPDDRPGDNMTDPIRVYVEATTESLEPDEDGEIAMRLAPLHGVEPWRCVAASAVHPAPPVWATQPDDGWYTSIEQVREHKLEWRLHNVPSWRSSDETRGIAPSTIVVGREPARQTAADALATLVDYLDDESCGGELATLIANYRAALEAEADT